MNFEAWHDVAMQQLEEAILADPSAVQLLSRTINALRAGTFPLQDALLQPYRRKVDWSDAWMVLNMHARIRQGDVYMCKVAVGTTPKADKHIGYHRKMLRRLPKPFKLDCVINGTADSDGGIGWSQPVCMTRHRCDPTVDACNEGCAMDHVEVPVGDVQLEIGFTEIGTTANHILWEGGLARWPRGSEWLYVFVPDQQVVRDLVEAKAVLLDTP